MNDVSYDHILPELRYQCDLPDAERKAIIRRRRYIQHPTAEKVLEQSKELILFPETDFPRIQLVAGVPGSGKTTIAERIKALYPPPTEPTDGVYLWKALCIILPAATDVAGLATRILKALSEPYSASDRPNALFDQALTALADYQVRLLCMDEFHNLFQTPSKLQVMMAVVRDLCNSAKVPLLCGGIPDAEACILADSQLAERCERYHLEPWVESEAYRDFVASLQARYPLKRCSHLEGQKLLLLILRCSSGYMNRIVRIIQLSACDAIDDKSECIGEDHIRNVAARLVKVRYEWPDIDALGVEDDEVNIA